MVVLHLFRPKHSATSLFNVEDKECEEFRVGLRQKLMKISALGRRCEVSREEENDAEWRETDRGVEGSCGEEEERGQAPFFTKIPLPLFFCSKLFNK